MESKDLLIVVDAQNDFLLSTGKLFIGHDTTDYRKKLGEFVNNFPGLVIATKDTHYEGCAELEIFPEHCNIYTDGWKIIEEIDMLKIRRFESKGSFTSPNISSYVAHTLYGKTKTIGQSLLSVDSETTIYVVGVCISICVHDVICGIVNEAKHLYNKNPKIVVVRDLVDDFDPEMAEFSLRRLQKFYGVEIR